MMNFLSCQKKLITIWLLLSGLIYLIILFQTLNKKHGDDIVDIWTWVTSNTVPTISLILGVFLANSKKSRLASQSVDIFAFRIASLASIYYLSILLILVFYQPISNQSLLTITKASTPYLIPIQGIVTAAIGVFFTKK